ncbi:MAG TPA: SAM-dependent methyltransferase [Micromonosporaceae bacterium]|nr:SAM-dependent methyltransferase [Micromonosporaceae bacterium]
MARYAMLIAPSTNRVYADAAPRLAAAELAVFAATVLRAKVAGAEPTRIGGVAYLAFDTDATLDERDIAYLSNLSSAYALFEHLDGDLLRPVRLDPLAHFDDDLLTIQKYAGKTNEQFTKLLLNVALLASTYADRMLDRRLTVLDPLCGRGTTLDQALMYGYHAIGIDTDGKDFDAYAAFIRTWLKRKRIKHRAEITPVRKDRRTLARRLAVTIAGEQSLTMFHADAVEAREFLKGGVADVIVADLPYGVAHGSRTHHGLSRSPVQLLAAAIPVWTQLIQPGGTMSISLNTHVIGREAAAEILEQHGLRVMRGAGYDDFAHWVDQSINRDVLVARKH